MVENGGIVKNCKSFTEIETAEGRGIIKGG
jgi:hypothetical protein